MGRDIQIFQIVDRIPVVGIREVPEDTGLWLAITVENGLLGADGASVNGQDVHIEVRTDREGLIWIPGGEPGGTWDIWVWLAVYTGARPVRLIQRIGFLPVRGMQKLVGQVMKILLSTPGSNAFLRSDGAAWSGAYNSLEGLSAAQSAVTMSLRVTEEMIITEQSRQGRAARTLGTALPDPIPPDEQLESLNLVGTDVIAGRLRVTIRLRSRAGTTLAIPLN